jgi:hypothetical protein
LILALKLYSSLNRQNNNKRLGLILIGSQMFIEISLIVLFFGVGYILGRLNLIQRSMSPLALKENTGLFGRKRLGKPKKVDIDESKFVTDMKTDSFKKKFDDELGKKTVSQDDIGSSVSKLSELKRK